jgi:Ca2+/H+ antiporter, TMEM165/GDT1 family
MEGIVIPFITILVAEFLDKSQLSVLVLATKTKRHIALFFGVLLAFIIVDGAAILFGSVLTSLVPQYILRYIAGGLFLLFGALSFRDAHEQDNGKTPKLSHPFVTGFAMVFLSEWGDKTQLASALFATRYDPVFVFIGITLALALLSIAAISVSKVLLRYVHVKKIHLISGSLFILLGILFLFSG